MMRRYSLGAVAAWLSILINGVAAFGRDPSLSREERKRLDRDKIVITDRTCTQIFAPYVEPAMPVFITSDSILHAYHVLLEESVRQLELAQSAEALRVVRGMLEHLDEAAEAVTGDAALVAGAKRRAQIVAGTASALLGESPQLSGEAAEIVRDEVARVEKAEAQHKPSWLGPPGEPDLITLDYSRYKPRGFYDGNETLARYFRAIAWLQSIPFRAERDEELLAALLLADGIAAERFADAAERDRCLGFFAAFRELIGDRDDWDLTVAAAVLPSPWRLDLGTGELAAIRQRLLDMPLPRINDQVATQPLGPNFRVVSAYRTPEALLFERTINEGRPFPTGLEVCVALGSPYAANALIERGEAHVVDEVRKAKALFSGKSLYFDYFDCAATLLAEPAANAPAFMSTDPWQAKSCQTALAGWAQLRHTYVLQSKQTQMVFASFDADRDPKGFVEPNPSFFARLEQLAKRTAACFAKAPQLGPRERAAHNALTELRLTLRFLEKLEAAGGALSRDDVDEHRILIRLHRHPNEMTLGETIHEVKDLMQRIESGESSVSAFDDHGPIEDLWSKLASLSSSLRRLAEKQLADEPFTAKEERFIYDYGTPLARLVFHCGHASETPRDDTPRIADVLSNTAEGGYLEVGIGRPRLVYVLYPVRGREVLCRGAVFPYHEFVSPVRLTDDEWKQQLDAPQPPPLADWLICAPGSGQTFPWFATTLIVTTIIAAVIARVVVRRRALR